MCIKYKNTLLYADLLIFSVAEVFLGGGSLDKEKISPIIADGKMCANLPSFALNNKEIKTLGKNRQQRSIHDFFSHFQKNALIFPFVAINLDLFSDTKTYSAKWMWGDVVSKKGSEKWYLMTCFILN